MEDSNLHKLVSNVLIKSCATLHSKVQSEIHSIISHIGSRIKEHDERHFLIPMAALMKMLHQHIAYKNHDSSFFVSPFVVNLTISFIDLSFSDYAQSLYSKHLSLNSSNMDQRQRSEYSKLDLDSLRNYKSNDSPFIAGYCPLNGSVDEYMSSLPPNPAVHPFFE